jgi:hypothetical protein
MPKPSLVPNKSHQSGGCRYVFAGYPARHRPREGADTQLGSLLLWVPIRKIGPAYDDGGTVRIL